MRRATFANFISTNEIHDSVSLSLLSDSLDLLRFGIRRIV
jgi:hypothetical protein